MKLIETIKKIQKYMTPFQWFEVAVVIVFSIYFALTDQSGQWWYILLSFVSAVCGIFCVVLCAAGKRAQYYWGFINIIAYVAVAWVNKYYGEVMLNALYFLPTQFVGMYFWRRKYNHDKNQVKSKKMSFPIIIICLLISAACIFLYRIFLTWLGGQQTWLDSASTAFSLIANALMVLRYREQWLIWIVVDIITVLLWIAAGDWIMTTMWAIYLLNAIYGLIMWTKMNRVSNVVNE